MDPVCKSSTAKQDSRIENYNTSFECYKLQIYSLISELEFNLTINDSLWNKGNHYEKSLCTMLNELCLHQDLQTSWEHDDSEMHDIICKYPDQRFVRGPITSSKIEIKKGTMIYIDPLKLATIFLNPLKYINLVIIWFRTRNTKKGHKLIEILVINPLKYAECVCKSVEVASKILEYRDLLQSLNPHSKCVQIKLDHRRKWFDLHNHDGSLFKAIDVS